MPQQRTIPVSQSADLPSFKILSEGNQLGGQYHVLSLVVDKSVNKIPYAQIILKDGDPAAENFTLSNQDFFIPGKRIEIKLGYHGDEITVFKGIVIGHAIKIRKDKSSQLKIECKDLSVKLTVGRKSKYFTNQKDSDTFEEIIGSYGLEKDVESTQVQHKEMVQFNCTDWDFVVSRAEANGQLVIVSDNKMTIKKPLINNTPALTLVYGATVIDFDAEIDARNQLFVINSSSWDYSSQKLVDTDSEDPQIRQGGNLSVSDLANVIGLTTFHLKHSGNLPDSELQSWANAAAIKSNLSKIRGRVRCQGYSGIKPGDTIELDGFGDRFNGKSFVSGVVHQLADNVWTSDIVFGLSPEWFIQQDNIMDAKASGLLPGVNGVQIGIVTQLENDPDGEDRILVKLPVIDKDDEGIWSRISTLDAGNKRGSFFRPEIGDEVLVAFINSDPRDAVVIGMLNSSKNPAPIAAKDTNHEKGLVTRSEMKLIFNDEKKSVTAETPGGNKFIISEEDKGIKLEDQNGNKIIMNDQGITIESIKDLKITSSLETKVEGGTNLSLKAGTQFKAEGSAGAEISSSGVAKFKGSLVQIN